MKPLIDKNNPEHAKYDFFKSSYKPVPAKVFQKPATLSQVCFYFVLSTIFLALPTICSVSQETVFSTSYSISNVSPLIGYSGTVPIN